MMNFTRFFGFCFVFAFLGGCGFSATSTFYVFDDAPSPSRDMTLKNADTVIVGIEDVVIPTYLDRPQIVIREIDDETLTMAEFHRWAEHLGDVLPRVIGDAVSERAGYPLAKPATLNRELFEYRVSVEIMRLDAQKSGKAVLDAWWSVSDSSGNVVYRTRSVLVEECGESYSDVVRAERTLVKRLGYEIADYYTADLKNSKKKRR